MCGGYTSFPVGQCERYDFKTGVWEYDHVPDMPAAVAAAATVADEKRNRLYVAGGERFFGATNSMQTYDPSRNEWTTNASMSSPRRYSAAAPFGEDAMVVCGGEGARSAPKTCEQYLFDEDRWTTFAPLNQARCNHGMANFKGRLYVLGGYSQDHLSHRGLLDTIEEYDATSGEWRVLDNCQLPKQMDDFATLL